MTPTHCFFHQDLFPSGKSSLPNNHISDVSLYNYHDTDYCLPNVAIFLKLRGSRTRSNRCRRSWCTSRLDALFKVPSLALNVAGTSCSALCGKYDGFAVLPHESALRDFNSVLDDVYYSYGGSDASGLMNGILKALHTYGDCNHHMSVE